jgi:hypothetical protein
MISPMIFASINNICSHGLFIPIQWFKNWNIMDYQLFCYLFSYIKRNERQRERTDERKKRDKTIWSSQVQTNIIFDRKLWLRYATQHQKTYDKIYKVNCLHQYDHFQGQKPHLKTQKYIWGFNFCFYFGFFLEII